ncbi:hypothetical protein ABIE28_000683 [Devosia sp. 2618]
MTRARRLSVDTAPVLWALVVGLVLVLIAGGLLHVLGGVR